MTELQGWIIIGLLLLLGFGLTSSLSDLKNSIHFCADAIIDELRGRNS